MSVLYAMENLEVLDRGFMMAALADFFSTGEMLANISAKKEECPDNPTVVRL